MALTDFLPADETKLLPWLANFATKLPGLKSMLGLSQEEVAGSRLDIESLTHLIKGVASAKTAGADPDMLGQLTAYKDLIKSGPSDALRGAFPSVFSSLATMVAPGILPRILSFLSGLQGNPKFSPGIAESLGIEIPQSGSLADLLPKDEGLLGGFVGGLVEKLSEHRGNLDISDKAYADLRNDSDVLSHLIGSVGLAAKDNQDSPLLGELLKYKDMILNGPGESLMKSFPSVLTPLALSAAPGILPRLMDFVGRIRGNRGFSDEIGRSLGILPAATEPLRRPAPMAAPVPAPVDKGGAWWPWLLIPALLLLGWLWFGNKGKAPEVVANPAERAKADLLFMHGATAKQWLDGVVPEFNKTPGGKVLLADLGTREARDHILYDKHKWQPDMWAPGDDYWIGKLQEDAKKGLPGSSGASIGEGTPVIRTYLCFIMPEDKAKAFEEAMTKPEYAGRTWALVADLVTKGWETIGAPADWGKLKIAQSSPLKSNSAMLALALMFNEYKRYNPGATINSAGFVDFMSRIEGGVGTFAPTTKEAMDSLFDRKTNDLLIGYEAEAFQMFSDPTKSGYRIVYPSPTMLANVPVGVVEATWVDDTDSKRAAEFVNYLLTDDVQKKAMEAGYRPVGEGVQTDMETFFGMDERKAVGMLTKPDTEGSETDSATKSGLIYKWSQIFPDEK